MRKIVLSRKGFDSSYGGVPSAFVRNGEMVSFPIPDAGSTAPSDLVRYKDILAEGMSLQERIKALYVDDIIADSFCRCHHDPDLVRDARSFWDGRPRSSLDGWRGIFGQSNSSKAEGHLRNNGVGKGDLFLFFGWFREAQREENGLRFCNDSHGVHAFFGYLQVGEKFPVPTDGKLPEKYGCFADHPHLCPLRLKGRREAENPQLDAVYIASDRLALPGVDDMPGWGVFRHSPELILTADNVPSHTIWDLRKTGLDKILRGRTITYHPDPAKTWRKDRLFQSAYRGQEFIVSDDGDETLSKWAAGFIRRNYLRS